MCLDLLPSNQSIIKPKRHDEGFSVRRIFTNFIYMEIYTTLLAMPAEFKLTIVLAGSLIMLAVIALGVSAFTRSTFAQVGSPGTGPDMSATLGDAKAHLDQAINDSKTGNSQGVVNELNMTRHDLVAAGQIWNSSMVCNNIDNQGFCAQEPQPTG
jgi:hypothetical protein